MKRFVLLLIFGISLSAVTISAGGQRTASASPRLLPQGEAALTPLQREIEKQRGLLSSPEIEVRRDALIRLGNLRRAESSRVAAGGLNDSVPMIRATAANAILSLPANESVAALIPLLNDKSEFVRQQVAYALGEAKSARAVAALAASLVGDKENSVRGAAAVALGEIGDSSAVLSLSAILDPGVAAIPGKKQKSKSKKENEFVARAAARALGLIGSSQGVASLTRVLTDEESPGDLRREAAAALGLICDASAGPALRSVLGSSDPHLVRIARDSLRRIDTNKQGIRVTH